MPEGRARSDILVWFRGSDQDYARDGALIGSVEPCSFSDVAV